MSLKDKIQSIYTKLNTNLSDINTSLTKKGASSVLTFNEVPSSIDSIEVSGGSDDLEKMFKGKPYDLVVPQTGTDIGFNYVQTIDAKNVSTISQYSFYNDKFLTSVNLPKLTLIPSYTFYGCSNLKDAIFTNVTTISPYGLTYAKLTGNIDFSNVEQIYEYAFEYSHIPKVTTEVFPKLSILEPSSFFNSQITEVDLLIKNIPNNTFQSCHELITVNLPNTTSIGGYCFANDLHLTSVNLPICETVMANSFQSCTSLEEISLPLCSMIEQNSFAYCTKLKKINIPEVKNINNYAFRNTSFENFTFDKAASIASYIFYNNSNLKSITFKNKPTFLSSTAFTRTSNLLDIYVPWNEGEVANAPWGATKATIHYGVTS